MRYCLRCDIEFEDHVGHCSDCERPTVDFETYRLRVEAIESAQQEPLDRVHTFDGPVDKAIICDMLADAGVPFVVDDHAGDVLQPAMSFAAGGGVLLVPRSFVEEARDIVASLAANAPGP